MDVRQASGPEDASRVRDVVERAFEIYVPRMDRRPMPMDADYATIVAAGRCWVAVDEDEIVGVLHLETPADHVYIETLAVAPSAQGRGVGVLLLAFAEQQAHTLGRPEVRLCTNEVMTENITYYPRRGYVETHRETQHDFARVFFTKKL
ncbi:GNAT family N-acetyltransferase [Actinoplanes sp. LDG1-06]|uniref:GNAT family N-acetyltransferase n=1 Tax=Paractinoplanes ovalisporus TaxID=2810368 RepID=A0ABS2AA87_9ACTN|nr:GNAT family N-acetyltransferase [Actinoplanes ovalisporus]MBM2616253.1 GNAT family N-acetyltransferase [Actinoplanes ovalisporus]